MQNTFTIILDDDHILRDLCGINDSNLKVIENNIGSKVLSRGNQIICKTDKEENKAIFASLISELQEHIKSGRSTTPDLILAILDTINHEQNDKIKILKEKNIIIPNNSINVFPKSLNQANYIESMENYDLTFAIGAAGTGKTYLAVAYAINAILTKKVKKLILTRPVVEAGESLGYLPGTLAQKIDPYLRPLYDAMEDLISYETIKKFEENRIIEVVPLAYMRGRSLNNCFIILDEAQNTSIEQMKMFLTRLGRGSRAVITGDITQIDLPNKNKSGLIHAAKILNKIKEISFCYFDIKDVVRNPLVKKIINAYEKFEK